MLDLGLLVLGIITSYFIFGEDTDEHVCKNNANSDSGDIVSEQDTDNRRTNGVGGLKNENLSKRSHNSFGNYSSRKQGATNSKISNTESIEEKIHEHEENNNSEPNNHGDDVCVEPNSSAITSGKTDT